MSPTVPPATITSIKAAIRAMRLKVPPGGRPIGAPDGVRGGGVSAWRGLSVAGARRWLCGLCGTDGGAKELIGAALGGRYIVDERSAERVSIPSAPKGSPSACVA